MTLKDTETVLNLATWMKWVRETGPNRGQAVEAILRVTGLEPGQPWCAAFVAAVGFALFREGWPLPRAGGCASLAAYAEKHGWIRPRPARGRVFLLWSDKMGRFNHTGFVSSYINGVSWKTIEGNTSPPDSSEGDGVFERVRSFSGKDRFIEVPNTLC